MRCHTASFDSALCIVSDIQSIIFKDGRNLIGTELIMKKDCIEKSGRSGFRLFFRAMWYTAAVIILIGIGYFCAGYFSGTL